MILLMTIAYSSVVFQGTEINQMQVHKYVSRLKNQAKNTADKVHGGVSARWRPVGELFG